MSATNAFETSLLGLIITNVDAANVGDAGGLQPSATAGVFWISLHTVDPGETGDQESSEADYTSYGRVSVARSTDEWTVSGNTADNDNAITFPEATAGSSTVTDFGLGSAETTAGNLFLYGALGSSLAVSDGITPEFAAGALDITLD
jgi:hypothetical protein